ncbi:MAG: hypothetical protein J1E98_08000 [Lachnospiraceae bacterium]|nr:hypothetical protein [Lachnospiraceae bacterium]
MLQISSGKFYDSDERFHNDKKGILYSNACFSGKYQVGYLTIEYVQPYGNISSYVVSFDNQIQKTPDNFQFVDVGGEEVIKQLKNILSFSLDCIFDEEKAVIERVCRRGKEADNRNPLPSEFISNTLNYKKLIDDGELEKCNIFIKHLVNLPRKDYISILRCIVTYNSSIRLLSDDISLAYSMLVYCLESLSQTYDNYTTTWEDVKEDKRKALEKILIDIDSAKVEQIKELLYKDENLKLAKRFNEFVIKNTSDTFFDGVQGKRIINKSEYPIALKNAYYIRSKYAHMLKPLMKQLTMVDFAKDGDVFEFQHDVFFTYNGLLRTTREVVSNFAKSLEEVGFEKIDWHGALPSMFSAEMAPYYWIWKSDNVKGHGASSRFEGLCECLVYYRAMIPSMDKIICFYLHHLDEMKKDNKIAAFAVCSLYVGTIRNIKEETKTLFDSKFDKYKDLLKECNIYGLTLCSIQASVRFDFEWETEKAEQVLESYNKKKYSKNNIKLPKEIETTMYLLLAYSYKEDGNIEKQEVWLNRAFDNSNNIAELQSKIKESISSHDAFDITQIWDFIVETNKE